MRYKYRDAKKYNCVFCDSEVMAYKKSRGQNGKSFVTKVRCSNRECKSCYMTVSDWVKRGIYYENRDKPQQPADHSRRSAVTKSDVTTSVGMIGLVRRINHVEDKFERSDVLPRGFEASLGRRTIPDWVFLAVRWAVEFGRIPHDHVKKVCGGSYHGIVNYYSRPNLEPKAEHEELWERLKRKGRDNG